MSAARKSPFLKIERTAPNQAELAFIEGMRVIEAIESQLLRYRDARDAGCFLGEMYSDEERERVDTALLLLKNDRIEKMIAQFASFTAAMGRPLPVIPINRAALEAALKEQGLEDAFVSITIETWEP